MSDFDWELSDKTMERIRNRHRAFAKNHRTIRERRSTGRSTRSNSWKRTNSSRPVSGSRTATRKEVSSRFRLD